MVWEGSRIFTFEIARKPDCFDLDDYIAGGALQFGSGETIRLEANISNSLARILAETPLSEDQTIAGEKLTATVLDSWQLEWWILGQSYGIEILAPDSLRVRIGNLLASAASLYH